MSERRLLVDVGPVEPCGCRWQIWRDGCELHIGAACPSCQEQIVALIKTMWPDLPVTEID